MLNAYQDTNHRRDAPTSSLFYNPGPFLPCNLMSILAVVALCVLGLVLAEEARSIYVCEAGDALYLGKYEYGRNLDGVAAYSNANDMSFFRNKGFWYLGDLGPWPPETHFRCVDGVGCSVDEEFPALGEDSAWTANKKFAKGEVPKFSTVPCPGAEEL